jgi:hypothetical protein
MEQMIPDRISNRWNKAVLDFVRDSSARSDVTEALFNLTSDGNSGHEAFARAAIYYQSRYASG